MRQKYEALVQLKHFLKDMETGGTYNIEKYFSQVKCDYFNDLENYSSIMKDLYRGQFREPVVLVLGKTGSGKSSICNAMEGLPPDTKDGDEGFCTPIETYSCKENTSEQKIPMPLFLLTC